MGLLGDIPLDQSVDTTQEARDLYTSLAGSEMTGPISSPELYVKSGVDNFLLEDGYILDDFDDLSSGYTATSGSFMADTTNYKTGSQSISVSATESASGIVDVVINENFTGNRVFTLKVFIPTTEGLSNIQFYLSSTTNYSSNFSRTIQAATVHQGWNYLIISPLDWTNSGGESWDNTFIRMRLRVNGNVPSAPSVSFDSVYVDMISRPKCVITFDDGTLSAYTRGYEYMKTLNLPGTQYVIADRVGFPAFMTYDMMKEVYEDGWDLGTHGRINLTSLPTLEAQEADIKLHLDWLIENGFTRGAYHYAYPFGAYNNNSQQALRNLKFKTGRTTHDRMQAPYIDEKYQIVRRAIYPWNNIDTVRGFIDTAIAGGSSIILNYHQIVDEDASAGTQVLTSEFQLQMDYIAQKRDEGLIDVVTISEWYDGLSGYTKVISNGDFESIDSLPSGSSVDDVTSKVNSILNVLKGE